MHKNSTRMRLYSLSSNDIQSWNGLSAAKSIRELHLDDLYLFSPIDESLYTMEELTVLHMQFSGLKGKIPKGISALKNLKALMLYGNSLTGQVPAELGDMPNLWHITLSENDFTGELPAEAFENLVNLEKFHIHQTDKEGTGITGKLPSFKNNTKLHMLDVSSNAMTGAIPDDFLANSVYKGMDQLMDINLSYNKFTGVIHSKTIKGFSNMKLDLANNQFVKASSYLCDMTDELRDWWNGEVGKVIDGGGNGCNAIICPKGFYNSLGRATSEDGGECVECASAAFAGAVTCPEVSDDNSKEKEILDGLYVATAGDQWSKEVVNWLEADVCSYEGIVCSDGGAVTEINVTSFGLKGEIPTDIWELPSLRMVDFSSNTVDLSFEGIEKALMLEEVIISDADLSNITGIENAPPSLVKLEIERNSFVEKTIPEELYSLESLKSLLIGFNGFSGKLSSSPTPAVRRNCLAHGILNLLRVLLHRVSCHSNR